MVCLFLIVFKRGGIDWVEMLQQGNIQRGRWKTHLDVISGGLNERYSKYAAFGNGNYMAEDAGKNYQYVASDEKYGAFAELHSRIYSPSHCHSNEKLYYILVCRATMGSFVRLRRFRFQRAN